MLGSNWIKSLLRSPNAKELLARKVGRARARLDGVQNRELLRRAIVESLEQRQLLAVDIFANQSVAEEFNPGGSAPVNGQFTISSDNGAAAAGSNVTFTVAGANDNPSGPADFQLVSGGITLAPGAGPHTLALGPTGTVLVDVDVADDGFWDGAADETVELTITGADDGLGTTLADTVTIVDDDTAPTIEVSGVSDVDTEDSDTGEFQITITAGDPSDSAIPVTFVSTTGTASPSDFGLTGSGEIAAGSTSSSITVDSTTDSLVEDDETVILSSLATAVAGVSVGTSSDSITIIDDDSATIDVTASADITEGGTGSLTLSNTGDDLAVPAVVQYSLGGTVPMATPNMDFTFDTGKSGPANDSIANAQGLGGFVADQLKVTATGNGTGPDVYAFYTTGGTAEIDFTTTDGAFTAPAIYLFDANGNQVGGASTAPSGANASKTEAGLSAGLYYIVISGSNTGPTTALPAGAYELDLDIDGSTGYAVVDPADDMVVLPIGDTQDNIVEGDENLELEITNVISVGSVGGTGNSDDLDIIDDDTAPTVTITGTQDGVEAATPTNGKFVITLSNPSSGTVSVPYTVSGTASNVVNAANPDVADHSLVNGTAVFTAGQTTAEITVTVIDSDLIEEDETVILTVNPVGLTGPYSPAGGGADSDSILITDNDDGEVHLESSLAFASEPSTNGQFEVYLTEITTTGVPAPRTADSDTEVVIVVGGTATPGDDYTALDGTSTTTPYTITATISAHQTNAFIDVAVLNDTEAEAQETVTATITDLGTTTTDANITVAASVISDTVTIDDDEVLKVDLDPALHTDGDENNGAVTVDGQFVIQLSGGVGATNILVPYTIGGGTANTLDFTNPTTGTAIISAGQTQTVIDILVFDDVILEGTETVQVTLGTPTTASGTVMLGSTTTDIIDIEDDEDGTVTITGIDDAREPSDDGAFEVNIGGGSASPTIVYFTVDSASGADFGSDFTISSPDISITAGGPSGVDAEGTLTVNANLTTGLIPINVINDSVVEGIEDVQITITGTNNPSSYTVAPSTMDTIDILPDQVVRVQPGSEMDGEEGGDDASFVIEMDGTSDTDTEVVFTVLGSSTADDPDDFVVTKTATIAAGDTTVQVVLDIEDDNLVEFTEIVDIQLTGFTGATDGDITLIGSTGDPAREAQLEIDDNDAAYVWIEATDAKGTDANGDASDDGLFTIFISQPSSEDTEVVAVVSGDATPGAGNDYAEIGTSATVTLTIDANATSVTVPVDVFDDTELEGDETVTLTLSSVQSIDSGGSPTVPQLPIFLGALGGPNLTFRQDDINGYSGTHDTYLNQEIPAVVFGNSVEIEVDSDSAGGTPAFPANDARHGLIRFADIFGTGPNQIPLGSPIDTATLSLWSDDGGTMTLHDLLSSFDEGSATWSLNYGGDGVTVGTDAGPALEESPSDTIFNIVGGGFPDLNVLDVTGSVSSWSGGTANYGWAMLPNGLSQVQFESSEDFDFGQRPLLSVNLDLSATVTICDTDTAVAVVGDIDHAAEPADNGSLYIELQDPAGNPTSSATPVEVTYEILPTSTAIYGSDYIDMDSASSGGVITGTATVSANATSVAINILVQDDNLLEVTENVNIQLTDVPLETAISVGTADTGTVNIADEDVGIGAEVTVQASTSTDPANYADTSGDEDTEDAVFTFFISTASSTDTVIEITSNTGTAGAGDFTAPPTFVTIPANFQSTSITVDVASDTLNEPNETIIVDIVDVVSSFGSAVTEGAAGTDTYTIIDDDVLDLDITATVPTSLEDSNPGSDDGVFVIDQGFESTVGTTVVFTVGFTGTGGTGTDFDNLNGTTMASGYLTGTLAIPAGSQTVSIPVNAIQDAVADAGEIVSVTLSPTSSNANETGSIIGATSNTASVTIVEPSYEIRLVDNDNPAKEPGLPSGSNGQFIVTIDTALPIISGTGTDVEVTYMITGGSATEGKDFVTLPGTATILAGQTSAIIDIVVIDDVLVEGTEDIEIMLTGLAPSGPASALPFIGADDTADESIEDNDTATITVSKGSDTGEGSATTGYFIFTQDNPHQYTDTEVEFVLSGTADPGGAPDDYSIGSPSTGSGLTRTVTIPAVPMGTEPVTVTVPISVFDDMTIEPTETVIATIDDVSGGTTSGSGSATIDITDNDFGTGVVSIAPANNGSEAGNGVDDAEYIVSLSKPSSTDTVVFYSLNNGGDANLNGGGDDYNEPAGYDTGSDVGSITISAGQLTAIITIDVLDDGADPVVEDTETVTAVLSSTAPAGYVNGSTSASVDILDDDSAVLTIAGTTDADENSAGAATPGVFTITLGGAKSDEDTNVPYEISEDDISDNTDLAAGVAGTITGTAVISAGQTQVTISVPVDDDSIVESTESVTATISDNVGPHDPPITSSSSPASIDILDDDTPTFTISSDSVLEGGDLDFTVTLSNPFPTSTTIGLNYIFGTTPEASSGDLESGYPTTVTFPAGSTTPQTFTVETKEDNVVEVHETFEISLISLPSGSVFSGGNGVGTIQNDDTATFTIGDMDNSAVYNGTVSEGTASNAGPTTPATPNPSSDAPYNSIAFTIYSSNPIDVPTDIKVSLSDLTASGSNFASEWGTSGSPSTPTGDYDNRDITVNFGAGSTSESFIVLLNQDDWVEGGSVDDPGSESFGLAISDETGSRSTVTSDTATAEIIDDDTAGVKLGTGDLIGTEDNSGSAPDNAHFLITQDAKSDTATTVYFTITGSADHLAGSGIGGNDYTPVSSATGSPVTLTGSAVINPGDMTVSVPIVVNNDFVLEDDETVMITLTSVDGDPNVSLNTGMGPVMNTATIFDDDTATLEITNTTDGAEPGTNGQFEFTLSNPADTNTVFTYEVLASSTATPGASAGGGSDYETLTETATISAGQTQTTVDVNVFDDADDSEGTETVNIKLIPRSSGGFLTPSNADIDVGTADEGTVNITDDDFDIMVTIVAGCDGHTDPSGNPDATGNGYEENETNGCFTIALSANGNPVVAPPGGGLNIAYLLSGTATKPGDFDVDSILNIPEGQSSAVVVIDVDDDAFVEDPDESVIITLTAAQPFNGTGYASPPVGTTGVFDVDTTPASILIIDNDTLVAAPQVTSTSLSDISGNTTQKSAIKKVTVTFDSLVDFPMGIAEAFTVEKRSDTSVGMIDGTIDSTSGLLAADVTPGGGSATVVEITFDTTAGNSFIGINGSLVNGNFQLQIDDAKVTAFGAPSVLLDGDADGNSGGDFTFGDQQSDDFFVLLGDSNGDGFFDSVDINDHILPAFIAGSYLEHVDANGDGFFDSFDINDYLLDAFATDSERKLGGF